MNDDDGFIPVEEMSPTHMRKIFKWLDAVLADDRVRETTFRVAYALARHADEDQMMVSLDTESIVQ